MGVALQQVIPVIAGKKITAYFELVKPLIEFKYEAIQMRNNNIFELATTEEVDKLGRTTRSSSEGRFTDEIQLEEVAFPANSTLEACNKRPIFNSIN
jgi:hypothetical protein